MASERVAAGGKKKRKRKRLAGSRTIKGSPWLAYRLSTVPACQRLVHTLTCLAFLAHHDGYGDELRLRLQMPDASTDTFYSSSEYLGALRTEYGYDRDRARETERKSTEQVRYLESIT